MFPRMFRIASTVARRASVISELRRFSPVEMGVLPVNPFQSVDPDGVGKLMDMCVKDGRAARPDLEVGICGEHGGDPASIDLCHGYGLNYVSCSPFRVPVARLAAAHAQMREDGWEVLGDLGAKAP